MENTLVEIKNVRITGIDPKGRLMTFEPNCIIHVDNSYMKRIKESPIRFCKEINNPGPLVLVNRLTRSTTILSLNPFGALFYKHNSLCK